MTSHTSSLRNATTISGADDGMYNNDKSGTKTKPCTVKRTSQFTITSPSDMEIAQKQQQQDQQQEYHNHHQQQRWSNNTNQVYHDEMMMMDLEDSNHLNDEGQLQSHQQQHQELEHYQHQHHQQYHTPHHPNHMNHDDMEDAVPMHPTHTVRKSVIQTSFVIGGTSSPQHNSSAASSVPLQSVSSSTPTTTHTMVDRMEGVEDLSEKSEIVVLDGANIAYAYGESNNSNGIQMTTSSSSSSPYMNNRTTKKTEPDVRGIQVAAEYFLKAGVRVLIVLPQYFWRSKPRPTADDAERSFSTTQLEILNELQSRGLLVPSPPADDDDAYCITIAKREDLKSKRNPDRIAPGYVLSNDMFRDAADRDLTGELRVWLQEGRHEQFGPGRISYTFFDNQSMNDRGEYVLDFQPNPRHPFVMRLEHQHNQNS